MNSCFDTQQDTIRINDLISIDSLTVKPDTICVPNSVADVTFYDSINFITNIEQASYNKFPYQFIEKNKQVQSEKKLCS